MEETEGRRAVEGQRKSFTTTSAHIIEEKRDAPAFALR